MVAQTVAIEYPGRVRSLTSMMSSTGDRGVGQPNFKGIGRGHDPLGMVRQRVAALASGDRTGRLRSLRVPTLVLHGADDIMCDAIGGRATAEAIPGAKLVIIDGMGHVMPRQLWPEIATHLAELVHHADAITATT